MCDPGLGPDPVVSMPALFSRYRAPATSLAVRICGASLADDAVQDAFFSIWRSSAAFEPSRGDTRAWVLSIVRNRAIDVLRREARHSAARAHATDYESLADPGSTHGAVIGREEAGTLRELLATLPDDQARAIELAYLREFTHAEVAEMLDLPIGTVKGRIRLGLEKLRANDRERLAAA